MSSSSQATSARHGPVLILGGGINGAAVARELVLNDVPVWLVEKHDLAAGATSRSSRLIHGGLRYLEYGDFRLVDESLDERARLARLAPQFVRPLRLYIPVARRTGGLLQSGLRFLGRGRSGWLSALARPFRGERGLWTVRIGLSFYDWLSRGDGFESHRVEPTRPGAGPAVDPERFRWLCAYSDAQMLYPERFVIAQLEDARQLAGERGIDFRILTHHTATRVGDEVEIRNSQEQLVDRVRPALIVNATGAWGDLTLSGLHIPSPPLFGGTKGSHFVTHHRGLTQALSPSGVYAEAADGRLVFVLPFGAGVLVGTTDERWQGDPAEAVASDRELQYLIGMVNELFPNVALTRDDVEMHYSGVRPLPAAPADRTAAISRDHWIVENERDGLPVFTLVGGKLTTCRAFAEIVADRVFETLGRERRTGTRERVVPGGEAYPPDEKALRREWERLAAELGVGVAQVQAVWSLCGSRAAAVLREAGPLSGDVLTDTDLPVEFVEWVIEHEWVGTLDDLVERRLMLVYSPRLSEACLHQLAELLAAGGVLAAQDIEAAVERSVAHLARRFGKRVLGVPAGAAPVPAR